MSSGALRFKPSADLPLRPTGTRGRFAAPEVGIRALIPAVMGLLLLAASAHGWTTLRPAFEAARARAPGLTPPSLEATSEGRTSETLGPLSPVFTPEVQRWASSIRRWSIEYALPPDLIAVVMQIESCGDPLAASPAGALGLFQVMPYHFAPGDDPFNAETNAARGLRYLASGLSLASDDPELALAGYNGGHGVIDLPEAEWAAETQRYVVWGLGILSDAQAGLEASPRLAAWLSAGGDRLCRQAAESVAGGGDEGMPSGR